MNDRIPQVPPVIAPLTGVEHRPLWSVMIPTYNCINYVQNVLESVLAQDPGVQNMQIEVIDDCSTDGDVGALVHKIGNGRVLFYKQNENRGSVRNFETCLNRSTGNLVHILHGDDAVKIGFYEEIHRLFTAYPEIGAAYTKCSHIDAAGVEAREDEHEVPMQAGIVEDFLDRVASWQQLQPPAMVVKRTVYEQLGGFFAVKYGEDWEMWIRIAARFKVAYSPKSLALYRTGHVTNITTQSLLYGHNITDIIKVINIVQDYLPEHKRRVLKNNARKNFSIHYAMAAYRIYPDSKKTAFMQARGALKLHINIKTLYYILRLCLLHVLSSLGLKSKRGTA